MSPRRMTPTRRRPDRGDSGAVAEVGFEMCLAALGSLADELTDSCLNVVAAAMQQQSGLTVDLSRADALRSALREVVAANLCDMLAERIAEIEAKPDVLARVKLSTHRETLIELLAEFGR